MNVSEYLTRRNVTFDRYEHEPTYSASSMAATLHVSGQDVAKTVALAVERTENAKHRVFVIAVLPSTKDVDLGSVARVVDARHVVLASDDEMNARFPDCESGAVPIFGSQYGMRTIVDAEVARQRNLLFEGRTHAESIRMRYEDFELLEKPVVAPIAMSRRASERESHKHDLGEQPELVREFLADHQEMSRLLFSVLTRLEHGDYSGAQIDGRKLNLVAGPHIQFEEADLYPRLGRRQSSTEDTRALRREHAEVADALRLLLARPAPTESERESITEGFRIGVSHAEHCGSLVSVLAALPDPEQAESLTFLRDCREQRCPWTDLVRKSAK